jgi:magnesium chelatase subunit H
MGARRDPGPGRAAADTPVRVVIVTLDHHLAGAVARAQAQLRKTHPGLSVGFHAASDWADPQALQRCRADIAQGDIILATMLFVEEHVRAVLDALEARREACDAMLGLMSAGEVVRLTKMGGYRMDAPAKGPLALMKRLRGSARPGTASSGLGQMKMLRRLPKLLRFIPGTAQDVRAYFLTMQYWLAGSDDNIVRMVRALVDRDADGARAGLRGTLPAEPPSDYPDVGLYHPRMNARMAMRLEALPLPEGEPQGTVGLLLLRSYVLAKDTGHYDGVIRALEAQGLRVIPAFAAGLDGRPAIDRYFVTDGKPVVDAVVSLSGFSLVGGPAYNDARAAEAHLAALDVPYVAAHPLEFQTLQRWAGGPAGLTPLEATMMVALPELDGATCPTVIGGRAEPGEACCGCARHCDFAGAGPDRAMQPCPERAAALARRVARLVELRRTPRAERRLAIVLFAFPPNAGAAGSAAFLSVFESLYNTMAALRQAGWSVELPGSVAALRAAVLEGNAAAYGAEANVHARISADAQVQEERHLKLIEAQWGPAPGKVQASSGHIHVLGARFGNLFVGLQPPSGIEGDPMRLLFEGRFAPNHAFAAFYRWIDRDFGAHAVLHFGTHGALEFMPGKQVGVSEACWPDRLIGDLPNFYLYAGNNPSEAMLAKRRAHATLISHLTPPVGKAGLYRELMTLKAGLERWRALAGGPEREALGHDLVAQAAALDLGGGDLETLGARLYELETALIPFGLHVVGRPMPAEAIARLLELLPPEADRATVARHLARDSELPAIVHALDGGYVPPAPGGDLIRNPAILPTGRNIHGFDPFAIPSAFACREGKAQAERLLARHAEAAGRLPETVAMVLWGTDNLKSQGAQIGQALALIGARPRLDSYGRVCGAELVPLDELGRPRIDCVVTLSGIFRDLLPMQTRLLAEAALLAARADEPDERNFVRAHARALAAARGIDLEIAALRVFSNAEGAYGANVNLMIEGGLWTSPDELAEAFERQKGHAYGVSGRPVKAPEILNAALSTAELAYQNLESVELGVTSVDQYVDSLGGMSRLISRARGSEPSVYIGDETGQRAAVRTLDEQVALETRTRLLNPAWLEPMLEHGAEGVKQLETGVTAALGWSATTGQVAPWVYQRLSETYVLDEAMRERLAALNPKATARMANRLLEASDRQFWQPDAATLAALQAAADALEDRLEGVGAAPPRHELAA